MINVKATGKQINNNVELEMLDEPFNGVTFYYEGMKFADQENEDGSINMSFDYTITSEKPKDELSFQKTLGDLIIQILEEQIAKGEVVYNGGAGGKYVDE